MNYIPRYSSQLARFIDLLSFTLTYPWITIFSLMLASYLGLRPDPRSLQTKLLHYFVFGPALASVCLFLLPFAAFGCCLWILTCIFFDSADYSLISFDPSSDEVNKSQYTFATMNVVLGQEIHGKFNNCSFVYERLKRIASQILKQNHNSLSNFSDEKDITKSDTIISQFPQLDFICFQEVTDRFFALALISMLRKRYSHFVYDIGVNKFGVNMFLANSGLMIASRYPILSVKFNPFSKKKGWQHAVSFGVVICKVDLGEKNVGIFANLHTMAYQEKEPLIDSALTQVKDAMELFRSSDVSDTENVVFDVICGDFNIDNLSPGDSEAAQNHLFNHYKDPAMLSPGNDQQWAVGTEMRQPKLNTPEMADVDTFRNILIDDVRRRHYILDADVKEQTFDLMYCEPKPDENGEVSSKSFGGMRRIDKILHRAGKVLGFGYVSALSGLTDHVPVVMSLSCES